MFYVRRPGGEQRRGQRSPRWLTQNSFHWRRWNRMHNAFGGCYLWKESHTHTHTRAHTRTHARTHDTHTHDTHYHTDTHNFNLTQHTSKTHTHDTHTRHTFSYRFT